MLFLLPERRWRPKPLLAHLDERWTLCEARVFDRRFVPLVLYDTQHNAELYIIGSGRRLESTAKFRFVGTQLTDEPFHRIVGSAVAAVFDEVLKMATFARSKAAQRIG